MLKTKRLILPNVVVLIFLLFVTAGTVSCSTASKSVRSPVPLPGSFSEQGEKPLPEKWWLSFDDPLLTDLIEAALENNFSLRTAWDRLAQAEAVARREGAQILPAVDGEAQVTRTRRSGGRENGGGNGSNPTSRNDLALGLFASYELDLWGRIRSIRDAAKIDADATEKDLQAAAITLSSEVANTWYRLVEQYAQIDLLKEQLRLNEDVLELITLRFRLGQVRAADVLQQRQLAESVRGDIKKAESEARVLEHSLAVLLGKQPNARVVPRTSKLVELSPIPDTGLPSTLIQRRPDVRQFYYRIQAADRRVAAAVADRFPRVSLAAQVDTSAEALESLFDNWFANLASNLLAPLFDGGARKAEVERARAVVSEELHSYGQAILTSLAEVEDALIQEKKQRGFITSLEKQLDLSNKVIERTRDSYINGTVDYLRVLDAILTHQQLERSHLEARRQLIEFRIALCRALGGGWEMTEPEPATLETKSEQRSETNSI